MQQQVQQRGSASNMVLSTFVCRVDRAFSCVCCAVLSVGVGEYCVPLCFALLACLLLGVLYPSTNERRGSLAVPQAATTPPTHIHMSASGAAGFQFTLAAAVNMSSAPVSDDLIIRSSGVHTYYTPHTCWIGRSSSTCLVLVATLHDHHVLHVAEKHLYILVLHARVSLPRLLSCVVGC